MIIYKNIKKLSFLFVLNLEITPNSEVACYGDN